MNKDASKTMVSWLPAMAFSPIQGRVTIIQHNFVWPQGPAKVAVHPPDKYLQKHAKEPKLPESELVVV